MANDIKLESYNEILGKLVRKILANTPISDIHDGSVILTLLEAVASNDFENNVSILNILELLNIDSLSNNDLDSYAYNLTLDRLTALKATGFITIADSAIVKQSSTLYPVKPAPIAGSTTLYVNDATGWTLSGSLYIGRGTQNFEGPIFYSNIVDNGSFFTISLSSSLKKDHLISEKIINSQGKSNRIITAGTRIKIPSNNLLPEVGYTILREVIIPAGEDKVENIAVVAEIAGANGNAGINTITQFESLPFPTAIVYNTNSFSNGRDIESDIDFKDRIKSYTSTLARGTKDAIVASIIGLSNAEDGKQVASAIVTEPTKTGEPSIVYLDDGSGFEPSFQGQSVDTLLGNANGTEEFLQLANYPLPRPQMVNVAESPYELTPNSELRLLVDGEEESVQFLSSDFISISSAQLYEISIAINKQATLFKCRLTDNSSRLLLYPTKFNAETIQVMDFESNNANSVLKFPINEFSYIKLYKGNKLLKERETSAQVTTSDFATWNITSSGNIIISVDNTPAQDQTFYTSDFNGSSFASLSVEDYMNAFNNKFAGITASTTTTNKMVLTSNKKGSSSSIKILGGSFFDKMFSDVKTESIGQDSDFILNRQNGNIQMLTDIESGSVISAGLEDTKGSLVSFSASNNGTFTVSTDSNFRNSELVIVADASDVIIRVINTPINSSISILDVGNSTMRILASVSSAFKEVQPNDFIYIANRGDTDGTGLGSWIDVANCGLYKIVSKGYHLNDGVDTYIDVINVNIVAGGPYLVKDSSDIQAFFSDRYPQIWKGSSVATPAASPIQDIVNSINANIKNVIASVYKTKYVKLTSSSEEDGSIAIPVSIGNAVLMYSSGNSIQKGNQSHIANKKPIKSIVTTFKTTKPTHENVWLDRFVYSDVRGSLTSNSEPGLVYGEELEDTVNKIGDLTSYDDLLKITSGNNKYQTKVIQQIADSDNIKTRLESPSTIMDYITNDEYQVVKPISISSEDNMVIILDKDPIAKTIDLSFSRTGRVNSGSQSLTFIPTSSEFSADDHDNEPGVDFGTLSTWGTLSTQTSTDFRDYTAWLRARNWYATNGANSTDGALLLRANQFGPNGEKILFNMDYPAIPNSSAGITYTNTPDNTTVTYNFASDVNKNININAGDQLTFSEVGPSIDKIFNVKFLGSLIDLSSIVVGDIMSIRKDSGVSSNNCGTFKIRDIDILNKQVEIYNINGVPTVVGNPSTKTILCTDALLLDSKYFILFTPTKSVKFWFNLTGTTIEPNFGITDESIEIDDVTSIMTDVQVATYLVDHINNVLTGTAFISNNSGGLLPTITVTCIDNGVVTAGNNGTSGFTINQTIAGINDTYETINIPTSFFIFSISGTNTSEIVLTINGSPVINAVEIRSGVISTATREEEVPVSYNHTSGYVGLYDSQNWVLSFQNTNPNFSFKNSFVLPEAALLLNSLNPIYRMNTAINSDTSEIGELFKLIPVTLSNLKHQLSHKALSQLEIVSDINYSEAGSKIQIKSEQLGSNGAIEVIGGRANSVDYSILGDSQVEENLLGDKLLSIKIPSSPDALNIGDSVKLKNMSPVKRINKLISTDSIDVVKINDNTFEYRYNYKTTNINNLVKFTISDVSNLYGRTGTQTVWRWQHSDAGSMLLLSEVNNGVVANQPHHYSSNGLIIDGGTNIIISVVDSGSISTKLSFNIAMIGQPMQADYITFENANGDTFALNFNIDSNGSLPSGSTYTSATNKIQIDILSSESANQILSNIASTLITALSGIFSLSLSSAATLENVREGDLVCAFGNLVGWNAGNKVGIAGDNEIAGLPIIFVDNDNRFFDVANPNGVAMSETIIGNGSVKIVPTSIIKWNLKHVADSTKYKIENLGYNDTFRLSFVSGSSPSFVDCGVAVDDVIVIKGDTFKSYNNGEFRILAVDNNSLIFESPSSREESNEIYPLNYLGFSVNWTSNLDVVTGPIGSFANLKIGDWIKKTTDNDTYYRQVSGYTGGSSFLDTTQINLGSVYTGTTAVSTGEAFDQKDGVNAGLTLISHDDICIYEGDSVRVADSLFISSTVNGNWFSSNNSGTFIIDQIGTDATDFKPFLRVKNNAGLAESNRFLNVNNTNFDIIEGDNNIFTTVKTISHISIDDFNTEKRAVYLSPGNRAYKWNQSNSSKVESISKVSLDSNIVTGIDGYLYYVGLMRAVQRTIDGYEPDKITYPGMKAVGGLIELLPPLKRKIKITVSVTTKNGINLSEISNEIKSSIINYVNLLKVGKDVIMSDIIVRIKSINGVEAVTLVTPEPSVERVSIGSNEKAFIDNNDVSIA